MTAKRRRGRPFKDGLLINSGILEQFRCGVNQELITSSLAVYEEYIQALRLNEPAIIPDQLLIDREEAWQCSPEDQLRIENEYRRRIAQSKEGSQTGALKAKSVARNRAQAICEKNKNLIQKIIPRGGHTVRSVATIIRTNWPKTAPNLAEDAVNVYCGEDLSASPPPSDRTLRAYIKDYLARNK